MSQAMAHRGCFSIAEAQAEFQWNGEDWQQHPSLCHRFLACTSRGMQVERTAIHERSVEKLPMHFQNASPPILTDGLMSLMPLSKPTACNAADWREAQMWLREMAGMGLYRIESIMDGMTLILQTKVKSI